MRSEVIEFPLKSLETASPSSKECPEVRLGSPTTSDKAEKVNVLTKVPEKVSDKIIAIEGVIGVGKTTLARMLADRWKARQFFEVFEDNPFLTGGFYENTPDYAFNTEIFFLLSRFRQQRDLAKTEGLIVSDYFFEKNAIFAQMNLSPEDYQIYQNVYDRFVPEIRQPDLIVFLQADLETLMRRIYFRDRKFERSLSPAYLEKLVNAYYRFFSGYSKSPVMSIQTTGLDFVNDPADFSKVVASIEERLSGQVQLSFKTHSRTREAHA